MVTGINANGTYQTESIQNITVGQTVLTKNQNDPNGPLQEETVTAVQAHMVYSLRDVTIEGANGVTQTIDTTDSHPFYVQGQGWVSADDLLAGETLSTPDGQTATVVGTTSVAESQGVLVYNFTVADDHTYFVEGFGDNAGAGAGADASSSLLDAVWVHNNCNPLRRNLIDFGLSPKAGQVAHHIVAQGALNPAAQEARTILAAAGIDIHAPINGVFLDGSVHAGLHTDLYYRTVAQRLRAATASGAPAVERELLDIANELMAGTFPH